jgi:hypothetical protein
MGAPVLAELAVEGAASDAQPPRRVLHVAPRLLEGALERAALVGLQREGDSELRTGPQRRRDATGEREIAPAEPGAPGEGEGRLDHVLELADVPGPLPRAQIRERLVLETLHRATRGSVLAQEVVGEQRDVLPALTQRRDLDAYDVEAVEEVRAEAVLGHHGGEVAVRRGDDPDVEGHRRAGADRTHLLALQRPQELRLDGQRDLSDLVEEDRPAPRDAEETGRPHGPGEGALLVAEELALDHALRQSAAVHGHVGPLAAGARGVDGAGDELLPRPALTPDEHVALVVRQALDRASEAAHGGRGPDELGGVPVAELLLELAVATHEATTLDGLAHRGAHAVHVVEGLGEVVERAAAHAADGGVHAREPRHHHDLHLGTLALDALEHVETVGLAEQQVHDHDVEPRPAEHHLCLGGRPGQHDLVRVRPQDALEGRQQQRLVVQQQDQTRPLCPGRGTARRGAHELPIGPGFGTLRGIGSGP